MSQSQKIVEDVRVNFTKTAANIITYYDDDLRDDALKDLQHLVKGYCENNKKLKYAETVKNRLLNLHDIDKNSAKEIEEIIKEYKDAISEIQDDVTEDRMYLDFVQEVKFLLEHAGTTSTNKDARVDNDEDEDEDFELTADVNVIDPISKKRMKDPVKNIICGHTYDKESITQLLNVNRRTKCPVMGCSSKDFVSLDNLQNNVAMKIYLEKNYPDKS